MYEPEPVESFAQYVARETWTLFTRDAVLYILLSLVLAVGSVLSLGVLSGPLTVGFFEVVRRRQNGQQAGVGDIAAGFDKFLPSFLLMVMVALLVFTLSLCLILPGLIAALFTSFAFHAVAYEDAAALDAIKRSFQLVKDNLVNVVVLMLALSVVNAIGGSLVFGFLLSCPLGLLATVVAYQRITSPRAQQIVTPAPV